MFCRFMVYLDTNYNSLNLMKSYLIKIFCFLWLVFTLISCNKKDEKPEEKENTPNIVFIMTDDHAAQAISAYGHPISHLAPTPNIDRIVNNRMTKEQRDTWNKAYRPKNDAFHDANLKGKALDMWKGQRYLQDYLATIASVDEGVGKILDYLEESGLAENTIIVYTTDQGFYLGEKGFFDKRFMYEESLAMPLLIQYPKEIQAGIEVKALTQNLDFAPTFLDFAGASIPEEMQGKSLRSLLSQESKGEDFRDAIYYHYYDFPAFHMVKKHYGIRTHRYKLIHFYDDIDEWEMYDLQKDPQELNNIYNVAEYAEIKKGLHAQLKSLQQKYKVTSKEFETTPKERVDRAYQNFKKLSGKK